VKRRDNTNAVIDVVGAKRVWLDPGAPGAPPSIAASYLYSTWQLINNFPLQHTTTRHIKCPNMSELPQLVCVKRKRGAEPTPDLFLEERSTKRSQTWQFRLQNLHPNDINTQFTPQDGQSQHRDEMAQKGTRDMPPVRREFRLAISKRNMRSTVASRKRKAQVEKKDIPTFIEATEKKRRVGNENAAQSVDVEMAEAEPSNTLKRPIVNAKERQWRAETWGQSTRIDPDATQKLPPDRMVDALQKFALEEAARDEAREKPKVTSIPKKPVQRFRDRNPEAYAAKIAQKQPHVSANDQSHVDVDSDSSDEDDYVYDTYVRAKEPVMLPTMEDGDSAHEKIGYIVITERDQPFWETYFEEDDSDKEFDTDDDDENGEK